MNLASNKGDSKYFLKFDSHNQIEIYGIVGEKVLIQLIWEFLRNELKQTK
jgi:hypothetical protein